LKNGFFWLAVVPIFTSDHERRMYSWIAAHHPRRLTLRSCSGP